jgi:hypothetical protein
MSSARILFRSGIPTLFSVFMGCTPSSHAGAEEDSNGQAGAATGAPSGLEDFSFFVTSLRGLQELAESPSGFGGDLRFGETGAGAGLRGADKICSSLAERSMAGSSQKLWRAFLSVTSGGTLGGAVNAIDRVGPGPWYDRLGRLIANSTLDLAATRPLGADVAIANDLPNEDGVPNHQPDPAADQVDNHDTLTGSDAQGKLYATDPGATCNDWTSAVGSTGRPRVGHSWPRTGGPAGAGGPQRGFPGGTTDAGAGREFGGPPPGADAPPGFFGGPPGDAGAFMGPFGRPPGDAGGAGFAPPRDGAGMGDMSSWISALDEAGCAPGVNLIETGPPDPTNPTVGSGGGYGGFYCFALTR